MQACRKDTIFHLAVLVYSSPDQQHHLIHGGLLQEPKTEFLLPETRSVPLGKEKYCHNL
jgi:hypothetical protein